MRQFEHLLTFFVLPQTSHPGSVVNFPTSSIGTGPRGRMKVTFHFFFAYFLLLSPSGSYWGVNFLEFMLRSRNKDRRPSSDTDA